MTGTLQAIENENKRLIVDDVLKKTRGITEREKKFLFNYLREGDIPENLRIVSNDAN